MLVHRELNKGGYFTEGLQHVHISWWRHQMETFTALLAICAGKSPVTGEFPAKRPVSLNFYVFFDLRLKNWLSKQLVRMVIWDTIAPITMSWDVLVQLNIHAFTDNPGNRASPWGFSEENYVRCESLFKRSYSIIQTKAIVATAGSSTIYFIWCTTESCILVE